MLARDFAHLTPLWQRAMRELPAPGSPCARQIGPYEQVVASSGCLASRSAGSAARRTRSCPDPWPTGRFGIFSPRGSIAGYHDIALRPICVSLRAVHPTQRQASSTFNMSRPYSGRVRS